MSCTVGVVEGVCSGPFAACVCSAHCYVVRDECFAAGVGDGRRGGFCGGTYTSHSGAVIIGHGEILRCRPGVYHLHGGSLLTAGVGVGRGPGFGVVAACVVLGAVEFDLRVVGAVVGHGEAVDGHRWDGRGVAAEVACGGSVVRGDGGSGSLCPGVYHLHGGSLLTAGVGVGRGPGFGVVAACVVLGAVEFDLRVVGAVVGHGEAVDGHRWDGRGVAPEIADGAAVDRRDGGYCLVGAGDALCGRRGDGVAAGVGDGECADECPVAVVAGDRRVFVRDGDGAAVGVEGFDVVVGGEAGGGGVGHAAVHAGDVAGPGAGERGRGLVGAGDALCGRRGDGVAAGVGDGEGSSNGPSAVIGGGVQVVVLDGYVAAVGEKGHYVIVAE